MPGTASASDSSLVFHDSSETEERINKLVDDLYRCSKLAERAALAAGFAVDKQPNVFLKYFRYLQTVRRGEAAKLLPFDIVVDTTKAKLFKLSPVRFVALDAAAQVLDTAGPAIVAANEDFIAKREAFEESMRGSLPLSQQVYLDDSLADDMRFALSSFDAMVQLAHSYVNASRILYERAVPQPVKDAFQYVHDKTQELGNGLMALQVEKQKQREALRANLPEWAQHLVDDEFDSIAPLALWDMRVGLYPLGEPALKFVEERPVEDATFKVDESVLPVDSAVAKEEMDKERPSEADSAGDAVADDEEGQASAEVEVSVEGESHPSLSGSFPERKKKGISKIYPDIRVVPGGVQVGVGFINDYLGMDFGVGIRFSGLDDYVSEWVNRFHGGYYIGSGEQVVFGERYRYEITSVGGFNGYKVKMTVTHVATGVESEKNFKLERLSLNHRKNLDKISEAFNNASFCMVRNYFNHHRSELNDQLNAALARNDFPEARRLHQAFFERYAGVPGIAEERETSLLAINNTEKLFILDNINKALLADDFATAYEESRKLADVALREKLQVEVIEQAIEAKAIDKAIELSNSLPDDFSEKQRILNQAKQAKADSSDKAELLILLGQDEYKDLVRSINKRLDNVALQQIQAAVLDDEFSMDDTVALYALCDEIKDAELRIEAREKVTQGKVNLLYFAAQQQLMAAKSAEEFANAEQGFLAVLAIDSEHSDAIQSLVTCYYSQEKYEQALKCLEDKILAADTENHFGLLMKGRILIQQGEYAKAKDLVQSKILDHDPNDIDALIIKATSQINQGEYTDSQETIRRLLAIDSSLLRGKHLLVMSYEQEMISIRNNYQQQEKAREVALRVAEITYDQKAKALLDESIARKNQYVATANSKLERLAEEITRLKSTLATVDAEQADTIAKSLEEIEKRYEILKEDCSQVQKESISTAQRRKSFDVRAMRFQLQSCQIVADMIFAAADYVAHHYVGADDAQRKQLSSAKEVVSNSLQLGSHYYERAAAELLRPDGEVEGLLSGGIGCLRYAVLSMQLSRALGAIALPFLSQGNLQLRLNQGIRFLDQYALPIVQLASSAGHVLMQPGNVMAGLYSFSPGVLLRIPEVYDYLLHANPREGDAILRFAAGRFLQQLNDDSLLNIFVQWCGYFASYSETLTAWLVWGASVMLSEEMMAWLMASEGSLREFLKGWLEYGAQLLEYLPEAWRPMIGEILGSVSGYYALFKVIQLIYVASKTFLVLSSDWQEYSLNCAKVTFELAMRTATAGQLEVAAEIFSEVINVIMENYTGSAEERKLIELARIYKCAATKTLVRIPVDPDGNCLFYSIAIYVEHDAATLRRMAMDYIREHREYFSGFIDGDFDAYVECMQRDKEWADINFGEPQIRALELILNRPIIIEGGDRFSADLTGQPIYISYNGVDHYEGILVPDTPSYDAIYDKYMGKQDAGIAQLEEGIAEQQEKAEASCAEIRPKLVTMPDISARLDRAEQAVTQRIAAAGEDGTRVIQREVLRLEARASAKAAELAASEGAYRTALEQASAAMDRPAPASVEIVPEDTRIGEQIAQVSAEVSDLKGRNEQLAGQLARLQVANPAAFFAAVRQVASASHAPTLTLRA